VAVKFDEVGADGRLNKAASERAALEPQADERAPVAAAAERPEPPLVEIETIPQVAVAAPSASLAKAWE
jgi:hypothetical protein